MKNANDPTKHGTKWVKIEQGTLDLHASSPCGRLQLPFLEPTVGLLTCHIHQENGPLLFWHFNQPFWKKVGSRKKLSLLAGMSHLLEVTLHFFLTYEQHRISKLEQKLSRSRECEAETLELVTEDENYEIWHHQNRCWWTQIALKHTLPTMSGN